MTVRLLAGGDETALEALLVQHRDTSMFLRSNVRQAGLDYTGNVASAQYVGSFNGGAMTGVAAHSWNGMLLLQAPQDASELARVCAALSQRDVKGLAGPRDQVRAARHALGLDLAPVAMDDEERFYALDLADLVVPAPLATGAWECRPPRADEIHALREWRIAYDVELLGVVDSPEARGRSAEFLDRQIAGGNAWVLVIDGAPASLAGFNATLPDIVQLGGIYTPPALRGRGYAKGVVAHSLLVARVRGVTRAVLFTSSPSAARTYEALGFHESGDYAFVLFR